MTEVSKPIRIGIIGLGHVAQFQIIALSSLTNDFALVSGCDLNPERRSSLPSGVPFFESTRDLLEKSTPDAVLVSTPPSDHFATASATLAANVDTLVEKPATMVLDEFDTLQSRFGQKSSLLHVAFHAAFARDLRWFLEYLGSPQNSAALGCLRYVRCGFYDPYVQDGSLQSRAHPLGGSWLDSGVNALSVVATLISLDTLALDDATMSRCPGIPDVVQGTAHFSFRCQDGGPGHVLIDTNWLLGVNCKFTQLRYDRARVTLAHSDQSVWIELEGRRSPAADFSGRGDRLVQHYEGVFRDFAHAVRTRSSNFSQARVLHRLLFDAASRTAPAPCAHA